MSVLQTVLERLQLLLELPLALNAQQCVTVQTWLYIRAQDRFEQQHGRVKYHAYQLRQICAVTL
jgi:hypothetical protein